MNNIEVENISLSTHDSHGRSHIEFVDQHGAKRLGRILPGDTPVEHLSSLHDRARGIRGIILPDGISDMSDGSFCLSVKNRDLSPLAGSLTLPELITPLKHLHTKGMHHLSIDEHSLMMVKGKPALILWGDGLLSIHPDAPCEVKAGGIPGAISDLYMLASTALRMNWLSDPVEKQEAVDLSGNRIRKRLETAEKYGYSTGIPLSPVLVPKAGVSIIQGGSWQARDLCVNQLSSVAAQKGWVCRVLRCAAGEQKRPLPDTPVGTVTKSPGELLENAFTGQGGIEKLLIVHGLSEDQEDFSALLIELTRLIPPGLRLVLCGASVPQVFPGRRLSIKGAITSAVDLPLGEIPEVARIQGTGASWYGPRCRVPAGSVTGINKPAFSDGVLFREGAWRYSAALPGEREDDNKAQSLYALGRFPEALQFVSKQNSALKGRILMALGRFQDASDQLTDTNEDILLAEAYLGHGEIKEALDVLKNTSDPKALPMMARLHDLSGSPASALLPLKNGLEKTTGGKKVNILCALRSLEMRLGMYEDALKHAEAAVSLAKRIASVSHLVKSLQERGRTLQVAGNWKKALEDFRTAVQYHDESVLSFTRPPHIDLFVLQLKMGRPVTAGETLVTLRKHMETGGILAEQMLNMLEAYRGTLLGGGKHSLPLALRAAELAGKHGLELYSGISTLYAGQLYIQSGDIQRGCELLRQARSRGHVLGDRHLVCLAEIELLLEKATHNLTETEINEMVTELPEEMAAVQVISGVDREKGFELLLDLPSPLFACRLAEKCGFPDDAQLRERIFKCREDTLNQLDAGELENYNDLFSTGWDTAPVEQLSEHRIRCILGKVSRWIQSYLESEALLSELAGSLNLEEISVQEGLNMVSVPGINPLYCRGTTAHEVACFLEPVASVLAAGPVVRIPPGRKDNLSETIIGDSRRMRKIRYELEMVAKETVPVLISGETGTGKELCARAIHFGSKREHRNFIPVDCGAIPEALMESEFFGAARGAYTGINSPRRGLLEEADGGTLFLDEIGNLPLHMQVKLLRVLDTGVFRRLGETRERTTDVRVVAATNADVEDRITRGSFRTDLYYRISVVRIDLPPLRERLEDIPLLVSHFTKKNITRGALDQLSLHRWPGNIRELSNVLKRASIASAGNTIQKSHISFNSITTKNADTLTLHKAIGKHIRQTVESFGGSRTKAATALKCDPKTLRKYLAEEN
ncbi:MAG: sigma 54-interacting transcriptional regulator [Candidatus Sabulitectum sp.]|nr:sigma 54-interacting transcriptional regulator [Candidatus Sabulitectum sp.]